MTCREYTAGTVCKFSLMEGKRNTVENITKQSHLLFSDRFTFIQTPWDHPKTTSQSLQALELLQEGLERTFGSQRNKRISLSISVIRDSQLQAGWATCQVCVLKWLIYWQSFVLNLSRSLLTKHTKITPLAATVLHVLEPSKMTLLFLF